MSQDLILMDGFGIVSSNLVPSGSIAIMLRGGDLRMALAAELRTTVEQIGRENVEGLTMAPDDFEKLRAVVERRKGQVEESA